ncbi:MAG: hypothetical protein R3275_09865 [Saprospiraceae bacterium]|nr:hypothetical protein [Saprospiraceae bacterium]
MEQWQIDFKWLEVRHKVKDMVGKDKLPDMNAILFLIGVRELGQHRRFTKEEKQDLMHIAVCRLLEKDEVYVFVGEDDDGWPHYELNRQLTVLTKAQQEELLKLRIIEYFERL